MMRISLGLCLISVMLLGIVWAYNSVIPDWRMSTRSLTGYIDSSHYHYLVKNFSYQELLRFAPNPQTIPFLFLLKTICSPFGCTYTFFLYFGSFLLIWLFYLFNFSLIAVLLIAPLILYIITPGKEGYILLGLAMYWRGFRGPGSCLMMLARPGFGLLYVIPILVRGASLRLLLIGILGVLFWREIVNISFTYQQANILAYNTSCSIVNFNICIQDPESISSIFLLLFRVIGGVLLLPLKSLVDIYVQGLHRDFMFGVILDLTQAISAIVYYLILWNIFRTSWRKKIQFNFFITNDSAFMFLLLTVVIFGVFLFSMERVLPFIYIQAFLMLREIKRHE